MLGIGFLFKKLMPMIKPAVKKLIDQGKVYKNSIKLEAGEVTVIGVIFIEKDKCFVSPCTARVSERNKLEVSRCLGRYDVDKLADLLIQNIGKTDLSDTVSDDKSNNI